MAPGVLSVVSYFWLAVVVHSVGSDDTATDLDESQWFNPRLCSAEIRDFIASWKGPLSEKIREKAGTKT